jgi:DNA-binding transcriptional regulator YiaG
LAVRIENKGERGLSMENNEKELSLLLEERDISRSNGSLEVNHINSRTFIGTKERKLKNCKITEFDKEKFQLVNSVFAEPIYFSEVEKWERDDKQPNKINLTLKRDVVFPLAPEIILHLELERMLPLQFWIHSFLMPH